MKIQIKDLWKKDGTEFNDNDSKAGIEGTISRLNGYTIIWINGSDHMSDWWTNFKAIPTFKGLHLGFDKVVKNFLKSNTSKSIKKSIAQNDKIIFAAHSQGCGFALSLMLRQFKQLKGKEVYVVFFGSPNLSFITKRPLNKIRRLAKKVYSFKNDNDPVCAVPIWPWKGFPEIKLRDNDISCFKDHLNYGKDVEYLGLEI